MTYWRPQQDPYAEIRMNQYLNASGTRVFNTKFRKVIAAFPVCNYSTYTDQSRSQGLSVVKAGNKVRVCMNASVNRAVGSARFDILIFGVQ